MKKTALAIIALGLVGMAPPAQQSMSGWPDAEARGGYPPCSKTVTDRCIQLYERGVATPQNLALNDRLGRENGTETAMGGPYEPLPYERIATNGWTPPPPADYEYPPCSRLITDRCIQLYERGVVGERG